MQNYFVFIPAKNYIKYFSGTTGICSSEESIENISKSDKLFAPTFVSHYILPDVNFNGHCLIDINISIPKKIINLYISYVLNPWLRDLNTNFTLNDFLFLYVELTKNPDPDKYKYSDYGIGFDSRSEFSLTDGSMGKNVIVIGVDTSSSVHIDNKIKYVLILGEEPTQGVDDTTLTAEAKYAINFIQSGKRFVLSLHYNGSNSFLFASATKIYQFKAKNSNIKDYNIKHKTLKHKTLCLGNISKDFTINSMKKTERNENIV